MPDKCHQKSFPTTCQAFRALWCNRSSLPLDNQNLAFVLHVPKMIQLRWFSWDDLSRNHRWVCFSSMGWGPWKAKVKIPRAPTYLSCFNICEPRGTLQNGMSDQTHTLWRFVWIYVANDLTHHCLFQKRKNAYGALGVHGRRRVKKRRFGWLMFSWSYCKGFPLSLFPPTQGVLLVYGAGRLGERGNPS